MNEIMTTDHERAVSLHRRIMTDAQIAQESLYDMCTALKEMRDGKLYREIGYDNFEGYCENEVGLKRRQVYNYIAIADKLSEDFVQPVAQIGMRKLLMLTEISEEQRAEIVENTDLENTTVKELQAQIDALRKDNADLAADREREGLRADRLTREKAELQEQITELESRPVEVAVPEPSHEEQNLMAAMRKMNADQEAFNAKMQDDHIKEVQALHAQHRAETDALREEYEQKLAAAQAAPAEVPAPDSKEIFKAYLANAIDAAKRMTAFLADHPNEACRAQAEKFFSTMMQEVKA